MSFTSELKPKAIEFNLLYVEDEVAVNETYCRYFDRIFKNVYSALNGIEGLEYFEKYDIDIIITDVNMPIMDGLEFSKNIKDKNHHIPIILVTANTGTDCFIEAIDIGIDKFLMKPLNIDKLTETLHDVLDMLSTTKENLRLEKLSYTLTDELENKEKELSLFKDDMIAIFTHELKTPLHAIINFSEYIHKYIHKELTPKRIEKIADLAHKINSNGLAQSAQIETLLDVSKYKAGKIIFNKSFIEPKRIIDAIVHRYQSMYQKEVTFRLENISMMWDKKAFHMLFENIFSNALKHSLSKVHVTFSRIEKEQFVLLIEDDGDGIKEEERSKIFGQFEQLDAAMMERKKAGTGLGLYLVKLILDNSNSDINVGESELLGGASFKIIGRIYDD